MKRQHPQQIISTAELEEIRRAGPTDRVAFLGASASKRRLAETLSAMANGNGGLLLLGVDRKGLPQAAADCRALIDLVIEASLLTSPPLILPTPQLLEDASGDPFVMVRIPPGLPHIYSVQGKYLGRREGKNHPLEAVELRSLLLERGERSYESTPIEGATLADLDEQRISRYLAKIGTPPDEDAVQVLLARGCIAYAENVAPDVAISSATELSPAVTPTVAGILLFGRNPQQFIRSAEIICVRYPGTSMSDEFVRQDIGGTLIDQIRQAEAFVTSNMRRGMKISGVAREETTEYPTAVVREAIVNAIAHRSYNVRGEGVRLLIFNDRLELYNPGRLPGHVTLENLVDERYSRNEAIVAVLTDLGYIERLGYGIDRMIAAMDAAGLPEPSFAETAAGFKITLQSAGVDLVNPQATAQPWKHTFLNERQETAMAHVRENGRITNSDYLALIPDVSAETIRRDLADLVEKNLLLRIGEKRATYYILK